MKCIKSFNISRFTGEYYAANNCSMAHKKLILPVEDSIYFLIWEIIFEEYE